MVSIPFISNVFKLCIMMVIQLLCSMILPLLCSTFLLHNLKVCLFVSIVFSGAGNRVGLRTKGSQT